MALPLKVTVVRVLPFGVFVRLPDGTRGYIRRRELALDADVEPTEVVQEGQIIDAVVIKSEDSNTHIELSRRATLRNPWSEFAQRYHEGDVVRGTVRALHPNGAFVRIQAGIRGFVPLSEIASWFVQKPDDVLWIGDSVEAIIKDMDASQKRMTLSIKALMVQRDAAKGTTKSSSQSDATMPLPPLTTTTSPISLGMRDQLGPILVLDDHDEIRTSLASWLKKRGFRALEAESTEKAILQIKKHDCRILLVDINLAQEDGLDLVRHLRRNGSDAHICVMSSLDTLIERTEEIESAHVTQVFPKPLDIEEIEEFLIRLGNGEVMPPWHADHHTSAVPREVRLVRGDHSPSQQHIQAKLEQVTQLIRAEVGLIFKLDSASEKISIIAQAGDAAINLAALYGLSASPVEDVIRENEPLFEKHVSEHARSRFHKLLEFLSFESCIGVPIQVNDDIQHAAFFFHREPEAFSHYRLRDAQAASLSFSALLTQEAVERQLQSINPMLLSGELARGFGHDVFNKITALDLEARLLTAQKSYEEMQASAEHLLNLILDLKATVQAFQQLLQTKETLDYFDVNQVVGRAIELLRPIAQKERAKIEVSLTSDLPLVQGNNVILQQVFLNLMLNAVQHMSLKTEKFNWNGQRLLRITTSINKKLQQIRIRFADNGLGIHQAHLKKIFSPGFSTRGGSGLGLYIARAFIQSLGGQLRVQDTLVPLGTTFVVEVPFMHEEANP